METIKRKSCRAVLLTPQGEVLLIKISNPKVNWNGWITPGGGLEEGESESEGLRRELLEELGFEKVNDEKKIWTRFHRFPLNDKNIEQEEAFYLIKTERFAPTPKVNLSESEMLGFKELRWWTLDEIKKTSEEFAPHAFPKLVQQIIQSGPPAIPFDCGI